MALAATVYMSLVGKNGLKQVAELSYHKAHYAASQIAKLMDYEVDQSQPFFNEFVVKCPVPVKQINERLLLEGIIGGYDLGQDYEYLTNHMLICCTEMNTKDEIDALVNALQEVGG